MSDRVTDRCLIAIWSLGRVARGNSVGAVHDRLEEAIVTIAFVSPHARDDVPAR